MGLLIAILIAFIVSSCSGNFVNVRIIKKGNYKNLVCKSVELGKIKGDTVGLRSDIYSKLLKYGLLIKRKGEVCYIRGRVNVSVNTVAYNKKVKIIYKNVPRCEYCASLCVAKNGIVFCSKEKRISSKLYYYISNSLRNPNGYYLYNNKIYKISRKCKPLYETIKCQRSSVITTAVLNINNFRKTYVKSDLLDSCDSVNSVPYKGSYPSKYIVSQDSINELQKQQAEEIASEFVKDFFPHPFTFKVEILTPSTSNNEVKKFINSIQNGTVTLTQIQKVLKYNTDYKLMYDVGVAYELLGKFAKAQAVFEYILNNTNNIDLKSKIFSQLYYLSQQY